MAHQNEVLCVASLAPEDHRTAIESLEKAWPGTTRVVELDVSSLKRFDFPQEGGGSSAKEGGLPVSFAAVVVLHLCEGRTLLTDADGLYNALVVAARRAAQGNIFIALTALDDGANQKKKKHRGDDLADATVVAELVAAGQTTVDKLHTAKRLLSWNEAPSAAQSTTPCTGVFRRVCLQPVGSSSSRRLDHLRSSPRTLPPFEPPASLVEQVAQSSKSGAVLAKKPSFCPIL